MKDDAVGVALELLAEHVWVERHLVGRGLHDSKHGEQPLAHGLPHGEGRGRANRKRRDGVAVL